MVKTYRLAKIRKYGQPQTFGPFLTLNQAESYRDEMERGGFPVVILNMAEGYDPTLSNKGKKTWTKFSLLTV